MPKYDAPEEPLEVKRYRDAIDNYVSKIISKPVVTFNTSSGEQEENGDESNKDDADRPTIAGLQPQMLKYIQLLQQIADQNFPGEKITVSSGYRDTKDQARIMISNWESNGGSKPIDKPYQIDIDGTKQTVSTKGTHYLVNLYGDNNMAFTLGHALETNKQVNGKPVEEWLANYWDEKTAEKNYHGHMSGEAVDLPVKTAPHIKQIVEMSKEYATFKTEDETNTAGPHMHVENVQFKTAPEKNAAKKFLIKSALNITVEPYESAVAQAMEQIASKNPNYFSYKDKSGQQINVQHVVLEAGDPGHFGKVQSDKPDTIFLSLDKIKAAIGSQTDPKQIMNSIVEVLAHEMGHLKANFEGGEAPAEAEANRVKNQFPTTASYRKLERLVKNSSFELMNYGLIKEALIADQLTKDHKFMRLGYIADPVPNDLAQSIARIVYHFAQKVKPESRNTYVNNIKNRLAQMNIVELAQKKKNPGAGVGATLSIAKNLLGGFPPEFTQQAIIDAVQMLQGML